MKSLITYAAVISAAYAATSPAKATNLFGIDIGGGTGVVNWAAVHSAGVQFCFVAATEGNYFQDSSFKNYMVQGKAAGIQMGASHFARPDVDKPGVEANYFWNFAGAYIIADGKSISPAVDFEVFQGHVGTSTYTEWFNAWAADVEAKTAAVMHPVIYVSACGGACYLDSTIQLDGWIANYNGENLFTGNPWNTCTACNPWGTGWDYWQVTNTGAVSGISGPVDLDAFNGTLAQLKSKEGVGGN